MTPSRWSRIETLFAEAADLAPDAQAEFLAHNAGDDPAILREVQILLAADDTGQNLVDQALIDRDQLAASAASRLPRVLPEALIGPYKILKLIGRGGMGTVYLAERADHELHTKVAIKLVRADRESPEVHARFRAERQILASLVHPNIARLFDGGLTDSGTPYLVMEYVEGVPITEYCQTRNLSIEARLKLFRRVCTAVEYAHRCLVVHRDIKPGNIMVTADGEPKLLDFGIARILAVGDQAVQPGLTRTGERVLTPEYAAPEQILNRPVTTATDVYSLGVLLYELLCGTRPFRQLSSPFELERDICEKEPELPSVALKAAQAADKKGSHTGREAKRLRGDVDCVAMMALRKDPAKRYATVERFSADIDRHLEGFPVEARKGSPQYRYARFVRRHWLPLAFATACALVVPLVAVAMTKWNNSAYLATQVPGMRTAGLSLQARGFYGLSNLCLQGALETEQRLWVHRPPAELVGAWDDWGMILVDLGRLNEAESALRRGIEMGLRKLGEGPEVAKLRADLAAVRKEQGADKEAEALYRSALPLAAGTGTLAEARSLCGLGTLHTSLSESERLLAGCLAIRRKETGEESMETADALALVAGLRREQGLAAEAEALYRRAIAMDWRLFRGGHPQTATHLLALSRLLLSTGDDINAEPLAQQALKIRRNGSFPQDSWKIVEAENVWAAALQQSGRTQEARPILEATVASLLKNPGPYAEVTKAAYRP